MVRPLKVGVQLPEVEYEARWTELAAMVRQFADDVIAPRAYQADRDKELTMDIVAQMA